MKPKKVKDLSYTNELSYKLCFAGVCSSVTYFVFSNITSLASMVFLSSFGFMVYQAWKSARDE